LYHEGKGVEKDNKKEVYHLEEAAIGVIPKQGTILEIMRVGMEDLRMRSPSATLLAFCDDTEMQPQGWLPGRRPHQ
jgi:hypothetical protein